MLKEPAINSGILKNQAIWYWWLCQSSEIFGWLRSIRYFNQFYCLLAICVSKLSINYIQFVIRRNEKWWLHFVSISIFIWRSFQWICQILHYLNNNNFAFYWPLSQCTHNHIIKSYCYDICVVLEVAFTQKTNYCCLSSRNRERERESKKLNLMELMSWVRDVLRYCYSYNVE